MLESNGDWEGRRQKAEGRRQKVKISLFPFFPFPLSPFSPLPPYTCIITTKQSVVLRTQSVTDGAKIESAY
ncbi:hypothetical protein [[Phormidium ambiguum] IAM M-71]|uniref:hypothetical protein n=1 Tax=[Phormidium ambiguum] IAM M-71 TaxID=454136 RepID=UPI001160FB6D|nr:hypothetical protein [Phormidium ambiguum]